MEGVIIECSREAVRRELKACKIEFPRALQCPVLFLSMPANWRNTALDPMDKHCCLAYELKFAKGCGVQVRRSPPLLLDEALHMLHAHCHGL